MKGITMNLFGIQKDFVKTIIRDTVETYSGQWRLVHEAIQNAHDSIHRTYAKSIDIIVEKQ